MGYLINAKSLRWLFAFAAIALLTVSMTACESGDGKGDGNSGLVRCQNCDDLHNWVVRSALYQMNLQIDRNIADSRYGYGDDSAVGGDEPDAVGDDDDAPTDDNYNGDDDDSQAPEDSGGDDDDDTSHSDTNVQEQGVDEADIIKTDGERLFVLSGGYLLLFDPSDASQVSEISRAEITGYPLEMFVYQNTVLVFSVHSPNNLPAGIWEGVENLNWSILKMTLLDYSDPDNPALIREAFIEGEYQSSRRIDSSARVVIYSEPNAPEIETWVDTDPYCDWNTGQCDMDALVQAYDNLQSENADLILAQPLEDWLPRYHQVTYDGAGNENHEDMLFAECSDNYHPQEPRGYGFLSVMTVLMDQPTAKQPDIALIADRGIVYASSNHLVVAENADMWWDWGWEMDAAGSFTEPSEPLSQIHMFDIASNAAQAQYLASGEISGFVLNQFSLGEYQGYLRVAATSGWWEESFDNVVYVLNNASGALTVIGELHLTQVEAFEEIQSARFMGDRGFVVTFEQQDPLFTIDLSDPTNPVEVGYWEGPGFSTYLHPMDEDHIMTIGVNENGGISLQIFDLTDFSDPTEMFNYEIGGWDAYSEAQYNHKAFLYYPHPTLGIDVLAVPVQGYDYDDDWSDDDDWVDGDDGVDTATVDTADWKDDFDVEGAFSGFLVFDADVQKGFSAPLFAVDHTELEPENSEDLYYWYQPWPLRSAVIGDYLYSLSSAALVVTGLADGVDYDSIPLPFKDQYDEGYDDSGEGGDDIDVEPPSEDPSREF